MEVDARRLAGRLFAAAFVPVAIYYAVWGGEYSAFDLLRLSQQHRAEEVRLVETRAQVDSLTTLVALLEDDPATIEAVARERFGMIRQGELLYRFVQVAPEADSLAGR
jgi:cell division protein FtsB